MENEDKSPLVMTRKSIQEIIRDWICVNYEYEDDTLGCKVACERDCPGKHAPNKVGGTDEGSEGSGDGLPKAVNEPES